jgi:acyl transferase domain-containing protein
MTSLEIKMNSSTAIDPSNEIAIIGMACRLPGAKNVDKFWKNLCAGIEAISFFSDEELLSSGINPDMIAASNYVKAGAVLEDIELFDAAFFGLTPREAELMDPQHRVFLECTWEALEHAGYNPDHYQGRIGLYAGASMNTYLPPVLFTPGSTMDPVQVAIRNEKEHLVTHTSYKLNLKGPSISISTACSTSLVAIHMACQSLLNSECDIFLAGGVSISTRQKAGYFYQAEGINSPDGHCRAFDAKALGTVPGNGAGIVVLKRLADALADGDCIHAIIKGSATNNDGSLKIGYMAPSLQGQAEVIAEAQAIADVEPEEITYIEAHGTGTPFGDSIEVAALTKVFRARTQKKGFCAIGSVETNLGHLDTASGVISLIKTVLALKHRLLPPSLNFEQPNPQIDFANSPFYVNTALTEWKTDGAPRRAGVSSFGIGGTNVHIILEEAPAGANIDTAGRPWQLVSLAAQTASALDTMTNNLVQHLKQQKHLHLADIAYTLQVGRKALDYRQIAVCSDVNDAIHVLETTAPERITRTFLEASERSFAFLFPQVGNHYVYMAWGLYRAEPEFRKHVDRCAELLKPHLKLDLRDALYPGVWHLADKSLSSSPDEPDIQKMLQREQELLDTGRHPLNETCIAQSAVFVIEYALARLWIEWIGKPGAMVGYGPGEYVAACLSGVMSLEDTLFLVTRRALIIDELELELSKRGSADQRQYSHKAPVAASLSELLRDVKMKPPGILYLSNVTGTWTTSAQATDPNYWARQMREDAPVANNVYDLFAASHPIMLEIGPGSAINNLAQQNSENPVRSGRLVLPSLRNRHDAQPDTAFLLNTLGKLWLTGIPVNWSKVYAYEQRLRVPLPTYPFERQRYWIEPQKRTINSSSG